MLEKKSQNEIRKYIKATFKKIDVKAGKCRFNFRCQLNAVHEAIENSEDKVALIIYINKGSSECIVHFVNVDENGIFTDNTLGHWSKCQDFYFIKYIDEKNFFSINNVLIEYKKFFRKQLNIVTRILSDVEF